MRIGEWNHLHSSLVSVIIPCYNQGRFLADAINSVLCQTYAHVEVIVVNDGSTDDTADVAAQYGERIKYVYQENAGLSAARNTGILNSSGEFIQFLDSDDRILPAKIEDQIAAFENHPDTGVVYSEGYYIDAEGRRTGRVPLDHKNGWVFHQFLSLSGTVVHAPLIRRACLAKAGIFDSKMRSCEDVDLWLRIAQHYPFLALNTPHFEYRVRWGETMSRNAPVMLWHHMELLRRYGKVHERCGECRAAVRAGARRWKGNYSYEMMEVARQTWNKGNRAEAIKIILEVLRANPGHLNILGRPRYLGNKFIALLLSSRAGSLGAGQETSKDA